MFVHERGIMGWNMYIQDAYPLVLEYFMVAGFLADLDLGSAVIGEVHRQCKKKEVIAHI